ncbi:hypothetical protein [Microvirga splendida]|uniref:Uncharacterized protein n=1 Tax=Microvirga splendida TaxID=2795727 RepID=A0ABS0Y6U9_9HYPH|nr:hypothetical protein [Microvirga splendida]MBJ6128038.1 hypothetical protein [Microvirga splendida]
MTLRTLCLHAFLSIAALGMNGSAALAQNLGNWRALTAEEEKVRIADISPGSVDPSTIEADFDGNGRKDKALIAINKFDGARGLIVLVHGRVHVISPDGVEASDGLGLAERGSWDTVCGNAFREFHDCTDYPSRVMLKNPGILWIGNGRTSLYFWSRKTKSFDVVLVVD